MTPDIHTDRALAEKLAQSLATATGAQTYVIEQDQHFMIQDDTDLSVYFASIDPAQIVATFQPAFPVCAACHTREYPPSALQPSFCIECVNAMLHGLHDRFSASQLAQTRQSQQIEQTMRRCHNCGEDHRTWQCGEIRQALFAPVAPWKDIALGRELCRMKWRNFTAFVALLLSVPADHLILYAASYQAFIRSYRPESEMTIHQVLQVWARDMQRAHDPGPAAPAIVKAAA